MMNLAWTGVTIALALTAAAPGVDNPGIAELKVAVGKLGRISSQRPGGPQITYQIRVMEMEGLGWRETWLDQLDQVTSQGAATVWTAPKHLAKPIMARAFNAVKTIPKVTSYANTAAHVSSRTNRSLVTQVSWSGEEPKTSSKAIREGFAATVAGRKLDQGVLVQLVIDDTEIRSVHDIKLSRGPSKATATCEVASATGKTADAKGGKDAGDSSCCLNKDAEAKAGKLADASCCQAQASEKCSTLQVAEVASQELAGEWLIPNGGMLVVGMGIHTVSDKDGKAVVRERLLLIEADDAEVLRTAMLPEPVPGRAPAPPPPATIPAPIVPAPAGVPNSIPTPAIPSRTLPQGIHADGTPAELPPLPPEDTAPPVPEESAEPHASPQNRRKDQALPMPNPLKPESPEKKADSRPTKATYIVPGKAVKSSAIVTETSASQLAARPIGQHAWSQIRGLSLPASVDRWIEAVRARSAATPQDDCPDSDDDPCADECRDEN
ncbi:MAG: hypothetical protein ABS79_02690 [Planctomycetes bacterium SCN 63-9]|nr:MAG: hypothetical protein ABS79_02690 [Planctomycetes bacterium SCN 63-9]